MKKFILNILLFGIMAIVGYIFLVYTTGTWFPKKYAYSANTSYRPASYGHLQTRIADIENFRDVDYLIIGSSHAYRGFDPRIFKEYGFTIFNLGSSSQTPIQSLYLLKEYIGQLRPDTVIIEVFPGVFSIDGVESSTDIISNDNLSFRLLQSISYENIRPLNTFICRLIDKDILRNTHAEPIENDHDIYISGGYVEKEKGYSQPFEIFAADTSGIRPDQLKAFYKMCSYLDEKEIPFILVQAPVSQQLYLSVPNNDSFDKIMQNAGPYLNYNELLSLPDSYFYNIDHLTQEGVEIFNREFLEKGF